MKFESTLKLDKMKEKKHLYKIRNNDFDPNEFITDFIPIRNERLRKYKQYTIEHNLINDRPKPESKLLKVHNKIHNSFYNYIVDQKVGYLFANPIAYQVATDVEEKERQYFKDFIDSQDMFLLDIESGIQQGACGVSYRLLDIETEEDGTKPKLKNIESWNAYILGDSEAGIILDEDYTDKGYTQVLTLYTKEHIKIYHHYAERLEYINAFKLVDTKSNLINIIPVFQFINNLEYHADFETVEDLIDAYDRIISDAQNEIEQFRLAYLLVTGTDLGDATAKDIFTKQTGIFNIPDEKGEAKFLTKDIPVDFFKYIVETLERNIYKFSKIVDVNDPAFAGGNESGEARKWKIIALEFKANITQEFFKKGLNSMFKSIVAYMHIKENMTNIESKDIYVDFTRTLPVDLGYLADTLTKLHGLLSRRSTIAQLPIVDDVDHELQLLEEERKETANLFNSYEGLEGEENAKLLDKSQEGTFNSSNKKRKQDTTRNQEVI
ncbi:phage portal protein, SPP1 family [Gottschalkia purinilytica]|uniref:Phage portal protein, SPP1 family n=1 Tax=Gottschalkia purinilytica TaxID=1503 RepID=A0A0L0WCY8_GOTPU|nr:phage portal protein [Gottschalkia purinilytica]KNF09311.1 phage portal protein, SPP1 family [Gottschalkia purinilytica]